MGAIKGRITTPRSPAATLVTAGVLLALPTLGYAAGQTPPAPAGTAETRVEAVAVGRDGRCVETLDPQDISVTIDGSPRQVLYVRRVSRGPGAAADAARRLRAAGPGRQFAAEPVRRVLVIVDQASIVRGTEATVVQAGRAFLDRLGIGDRAGVIGIPLDSDRQIELTMERPAAREALGLVRGLLAPPTHARGDPLAPSAERAAMSDPGRLSESQPSSQGAAPPRMATGPQPAGAAGVNTSLGAVAAILQSLQATPGRKAVALFSRGFGDAPGQALAEMSAAAIAAGATVYGIQLTVPQSDWETRRRDAVTLEALAVSTGGSFAVLGKTPEHIFDGVIEAMSAVQVIGLAPAPGDLDGTRRAVRVESRRAGLTVRAPAWLLPSAERGDQQPALETGPPAAAAERSTGARGAGPPEATAPVEPDRNPELALALDRAFEYVQAYEAEYSALVAEEHYEQFAGRQYVRLRSDFLLVNQESTEGWVCFRDVFEVDGKPVRDREDRLEKLFLEPSPDAWARLMRIKDESARYNIGAVDRNINLPLFALQFLRAEHRTRFRFKIAGRPESGGVRTWRIEFTETARPTIIRDPEDRDVPASGWFLVDQGTGAVVETVLRVGSRATSTEIVATFRRDPDFGMWVPSEMRETHRTTRLPASSRDSVFLQGKATYAHFRRFQVHTDVVIAIKK